MVRLAKKSAFVFIAVIIFGTTFAIAATFIINNNIQGDTAVGIVITTGTNLQGILTQFSIQREQKDCSNPDATTTPIRTCEYIKIFFEGREVSIFIAIPASMITPSLINKLSGIPITQQLYYETGDVDSKLIQMMEEQGYATYAIIHEQ